MAGVWSILLLMLSSLLQELTVVQHKHMQLDFYTKVYLHICITLQPGFLITDHQSLKTVSPIPTLITWCHIMEENFVFILILLYYYSDILLKTVASATAGLYSVHSVDVATCVVTMDQLLMFGTSQTNSDVLPRSVLTWGTFKSNHLEACRWYWDILGVYPTKLYRWRCIYKCCCVDS